MLNEKNYREAKTILKLIEGDLYNSSRPDHLIIQDLLLVISLLSSKIKEKRNAALEA